MLAAAAVLVVATATGGVVVDVRAPSKRPRPHRSRRRTPRRWSRGKLSAMVSLDGTLTYRARSDGSPYAVINQARGTYTKLPEDGDKVGCGDVLYRVDDKPVLLLCGTVPAYRDLHVGRCGQGCPSAQPRTCAARVRRRAHRPSTDDVHLETARRSRSSSTTRACR